ncbi:MAG: biotin/lipoate A/B protein ligase family protein [Candidatus Aenigmatarchaeota archaeon]
MTFRLIESDPVENSYQKMAMDEAILQAVSKGKVKPTLRFYRWSKPAVAIGYFQSVEEEVDREKCREDGVEIFRRMTGGGAVYKDPTGELNYSVIVPEELSGMPSDIEESYRKISECIIRALEKIGIEADHSGINDVVVEGRKISGNAQTRKRGVLLQHGTLLLDFEPEKMVRYLKISEEKSKDKIASGLEGRVTTLKERRPGLTREEVEKVLKEGFSEELSQEIEKGELTDWEKEKARELYREKYSTEEWNFMR